MKRIIIAMTTLALSSSMAFADKPNNNGAGGQLVKTVSEAVKAGGSNLGQWKKENNISGKTQGAIVSAVNDAANHD